MGLTMPGECIVLREQLKLDKLPCADRCVRGLFPTHRKEGRPLGCWIAHTALTILECERVRPRLERAFRRVEWWRVQAATALHDIGKLSECYVNGVKGVQHNVLSSAVALIVCGDKIVSTAIFLHHEAMHWSRMYKTPLRLFQRIEDSVSERTCKALREGFKLHDRCKDALMGLMYVLNRMGLKNVFDMLEDVSMKREYKVSIKDLRIESRFLMNSLPVYWVLFMADNRAASARDGSEAYWLNVLKRFSEASRTPSKLADRILRDAKIRNVAVMLTALPKL